MPLKKESANSLVFEGGQQTFSFTQLKCGKGKLWNASSKGKDYFQLRFAFHLLDYFYDLTPPSATPSFAPLHFYQFLEEGCMGVAETLVDSNPFKAFLEKIGLGKLKENLLYAQNQGSGLALDPDESQRFLSVFKDYFDNLVRRNTPATARAPAGALSDLLCLFVQKVARAEPFKLLTGLPACVISSGDVQQNLLLAQGLTWPLETAWVRSTRNGILTQIFMKDLRAEELLPYVHLKALRERSPNWRDELIREMDPTTLTRSVQIQVLQCRDASVLHSHFVQEVFTVFRGEDVVSEQIERDISFLLELELEAHFLKSVSEPQGCHHCAEALQVKVGQTVRSLLSELQKRSPPLPTRTNVSPLGLADELCTLYWGARNFKYEWQETYARDYIKERTSVLQYLEGLAKAKLERRR